MKVWMDDVRPAPKGWFWAKTAMMALAAVQHNPVDEMSLDHDLGHDLMNGHWAVKALMTFDERPEVIAVHTANPGGRRLMEGTLLDHGYQDEGGGRFVLPDDLTQPPPVL